MTTQPLINTRIYTRPIALRRDAVRPRLNVRWDMLIVRLMMVSGLLIAGLMACGILPLSWLLIGIGFVMSTVGVITWLIRLGEIALPFASIQTFIVTQRRQGKLALATRALCR